MPFISVRTNIPLHGVEHACVTLQSFMPISETKSIQTVGKQQCKEKYAETHCHCNHLCLNNLNVTSLIGVLNCRCK